MPPDYHHGELPDALRHAAVEVITERGLGGFSLREVARRAGVSHAAPAHHFGDARGLLTALAADGFEAVATFTKAAAETHDDPIEALVAAGKAYVNLALSHPAHCQLMMRRDVIDVDDERYQMAGLVAWSVLTECIEAACEQLGSDADVQTVAKLCWSAMQGIVELYDNMVSLDAQLGTPTPSRDELIESYTHTIIDGLRPAR